MNNKTFNIEELRIIRLALKKMIESKERTLARTYRVSLPSLKEQQKIAVANLRQEIAVTTACATRWNANCLRNS